jgi:hypothetical protein
MVFNLVFNLSDPFLKKEKRVDELLRYPRNGKVLRLGNQNVPKNCLRRYLFLTFQIPFLRLPIR